LFLEAYQAYSQGWSETSPTDTTSFAVAAAIAAVVEVNVDRVVEVNVFSGLCPIRCCSAVMSWGTDLGLVAIYLTIMVMMIMMIVKLLDEPHQSKERMEVP
jgi:hypothetical protein